MAMVLVTMYNADMVVLPWEKPVLFSPTPPAAPPFIGQPAYYSSREIKAPGEPTVQIRGSRSTGILLADDVILTVYNTAPFAMKWEYKAEIRLKTLLQTEVCLFGFQEDAIRQVCGKRVKIQKALTLLRSRLCPMRRTCELANH